MKVAILFVLSFVVISALPFLWNQFQFVEVGFPFVYVHRSVIESPEIVQHSYMYVTRYLLYDLILVAVSIWLFSKIRTVVGNRTSR
jgi:hypothetical protein